MNCSNYVFCLDQHIKKSWFETPYENMEEVLVCENSGDIASLNCKNLFDNIKLVKFEKRAKQCRNKRFSK